MADFTNIDGVYAKDTELRSGIDTLRTTVLSNTIKPLTVTKNGTYTAIPSSGTYGYSPITVDVQEEPWEPLEDGYSNFWFELTDDTLSPWLNFSAKNNDATIDWGDGSGEVTLDTLTPTHTYAKAGKYVVKVKGVTGIGRQITINGTKGAYCTILRNVECNSEITGLVNYAFWQCVRLENAYIHNNNMNLSDACFYNCYNFEHCNIPSNATSLGGSCFQNCSFSDVTMPNKITTMYNGVFYGCTLLENIVLSNSLTTIYNNNFANCYSLKAIHVQSTTPPTLGTNNFTNLPLDYIIYVPTGTGDTYKSAAGWSDYADHIVEEGQTLSMAALRRIQAEKNDNGEEMR